MSKRRPGFERRDRDNYPTPLAAAEPLLAHLKRGAKFVEPCCGEGALADHLKHAGLCLIAAYDWPPHDARTMRYDVEPDVIAVTNPPWRRETMHAILANVSDQMPLWALVDSDWFFTSQATPYLPRLRAIVAVGRVRWIQGSKHNGMENCCWALFGKPRLNQRATLRFIGRV